MFTPSAFLPHRPPLRARRQLLRAALCSLPVALLGACGDSGYERSGGRWMYDGQPVAGEPGSDLKALAGPFARDGRVGYFRGTPIEGSHGPSFQVLDGQYARDQSRAYFCDTFRKGQEYYTVKHNRIVVLEGVAVDSFRSLQQGYARDASRLYFEGAPVEVKDLESFEVLASADYQRDRVAAYFRRRLIAGSDGSSFEVLGGGYSKDKAAVYFSHYRSTDPAMQDRTLRVAGALPASFAVAAGGYAQDARQVYHNGSVITRDVASFQMLGSLYAKTASVVFFDGKAIAAADAASFVVLDSPEADADARDARRRYRHGVPVAAPR